MVFLPSNEMQTIWMPAIITSYQLTQRRVMSVTISAHMISHHVPQSTKTHFVTAQSDPTFP